MIRHAILFAVAALTACGTAGPVYERPDVGLTTRDQFVWAVAPAAEPARADLYWWKNFEDPLLNEWVERALAENLDIAIASERISQARALLRSARAERTLSLDGVLRGAITERRASSDANRRATTGGVAGNVPALSGATGTISAGLNLGWDADLWGGLRQAERSAAASVLRSQDLAQAARLATAALAARTYLAWREAQHEQALFRQSLRLREETLRVVAVRVDVGLAPSLDLSRARADLAAVQAELDDATRRARQSRLALQVLAAQRPVAITQTESPPPIPQPQADRALPRPVDLLRLRPDIRAAEAALVAAVAEIGVAESALYPQLTLPGELVLTSSGLGAGTIANALTASLAAVLQMPLFDDGQRAAAVDDRRSRAREAALRYRQTVLLALEQVETALLSVRAVQSQLDALLVAAETSETALGQARTLYDEGLTGFLDVLEAQRSALNNKLELMRGRAAAARAAIATHEAVGLVSADTGAVAAMDPGKQSPDQGTVRVSR